MSSLRLGAHSHLNNNQAGDGLQDLVVGSPNNFAPSTSCPPSSPGCKMLTPIYTTQLWQCIPTADDMDVAVLGGLNPPAINIAFISLLATFDLHNHVTFPTHCTGSSLDP
ncbi:hypothetical protein E2C01_035425 [Portunus trituberculatus]|uniref:Uncharacterized protein n=1 Tax=Portunus trituberculatus TaxID=210409 RepID=A0A5B7F9A6_PORTR|nr:hypothetical protein [Portunus trituberculatus]